jgi:hypothetical protein
LSFGNRRNIISADLFSSTKFKGTVSPDYKWLEVTPVKSPLLGHVTLVIKKILNSPFNFQWAFKVLKHTTPNTFQFSFLLEHE